VFGTFVKRVNSTLAIKTIGGGALAEQKTS